MTVLVACGLAREARIIAGPGVIAIAGGGDPARLEAALEAHARQARAILSSGLCGALDPTLKIGDLVVGRTSELADRGPSFTSPRRRGEDPRLSFPEEDNPLLAFLRGRLPHARSGVVVGVDRIVATAAEKRALRAATGAIAVDMESHVAERVARSHRLPFAIVRSVSDGAGQSLPSAALVGMRPDGGVALGAVLSSIARNPAQIPALIATGINAKRAFRALLRGCRRLRAGDFDPSPGHVV